MKKDIKKSPILVIDTALPETLVMLAVDGVIIATVKDEAARRADRLLDQIDQALIGQNIELCDLRLIVVRKGLGSYTGLRVGVTVANTLAWSLGIPVMGLISEQENLLTQAQVFDSLQNLKTVDPKTGVFEPVVPIYGAWRDGRDSANLK